MSYRYFSRLFIVGLFGLFAAVAMAESYSPMKTIEMKLKGNEWLVLEQFQFSTGKVQFLRLRRARKTMAVTTITPAQFDLWRKNAEALKASSRRPACKDLFEMTLVDGAGRREVKFCQGGGTDPLLKSVQVARQEMLAFLKEHDSLKSKRLRK